MNESKWIALSPNSIAPSVHPVDATWAEESPSPYDIPSHVRINYQEGTGRAIISFRYIESEPTVEVKLGNFAIVHVGRRSRRIWSIDFDMNALHLGKQGIKDAVMQSVQSISTNDAVNRDIAAKAISSKSGSLFEVAA